MIHRTVPLVLTVVVLFLCWNVTETTTPERFSTRLHAWLAPAWWYLIPATAIAWWLVLACLLDRWGVLPGILRRLVPELLLEPADETLAEAELAPSLDNPVQQAVVINAQSLGRALAAQLPTQAALCHGLAAHLRRRMAMTQRLEPVAVYLIAGAEDTGKATLIRRLASELQRPLLTFDPRGNTPGKSLLDTIAAGLHNHPDAVIHIDPLEALSAVETAQLVRGLASGRLTLDARRVGPTDRAIFVLTTKVAHMQLGQLVQLSPASPASAPPSAAGLSLASIDDYADDEDAEKHQAQAMALLRQHKVDDSLLQCVDHVFVFAAPQPTDIVLQARLELTAMIARYGLAVADNGIDPAVIEALVARFRANEDSTATQQLVRRFESSIADSLIKARQAGCKTVELRTEQGKLRARAVREKARA